MRYRRSPPEVLLAVVIFALFWFLLAALAVAFYGCGELPAAPPLIAPSCECVLIPKKDAQDLRTSFPDTAAVWRKACDGSTGYLAPWLLPPGTLRSYQDGGLHERWMPAERLA